MAAMLREGAITSIQSLLLGLGEKIIFEFHPEARQC